jgi:hypothetical protein
LTDFEPTCVVVGEGTGAADAILVVIALLYLAWTRIHPLSVEVAKSQSMCP